MNRVRIIEVTVLLATSAGILIGCTSTEEPEYQGRRGATPSVEDYYPPKSNHAPAKASHDELSPSQTANVPQDPKAILTALETHLQQMAAALQRKDAREAHQHDSAIRRLVAQLARAPLVSSQANVDVLAREISDAARAAHTAAHDDQWTVAADHVKHGQASLAKLRPFIEKSAR